MWSGGQLMRKSRHWSQRPSAPLNDELQHAIRLVLVFTCPAGRAPRTHQIMPCRPWIRILDRRHA